MNPPRPSRQDPALYQPSRNPPPAKPSAPGNVMMYNPNQYNAGYPPSNGSWGPPRQQPPLQQQQQQQQQAPLPTNQESWNWDENVNNFQNYTEPSQTAAMAPKLQNAPPANPPNMYNVPDYSLPQQVSSYQPEHAVNNNQYDSQASSSNQNWGWNDGEDWGWGNEYQQQQNTQQTQLPQPPLPAGPVENQQPTNFPNMPPLPGSSGLETGFSTMSLSNQEREETQGEQQQQPAWSQPQHPTPALPEESNAASWSRVPTWGSALDHEQGSYEPGAEQSYPRELGERNTFADGASFTDPSQSLPPATASLSNDQMYAPTGVVQPAPPEQQQQLYAGGRVMHPPPSTLNLGAELIRVSPTPQVGPNMEQTETGADLAASVEPEVAPPVSMNRINPGLSYGSMTEGFNNGPQGVPFSAAEFPGAPPVGGLPISNIDLSIGNRLPGSGSRSQSGTPSMERESERPDAEGGYENDQPTPLFSQPPTAPYGALAERKVAQESPAESRPSSRLAGSTPSTETPIANPSPYHLPGDGNAFVRPKPVSSTGSFYPVATTSHITAAPTPLATPAVARGSQEAVGSEFGPPMSAVPLSRADNLTTSSSMLPPSSQRMIPGSGSHPHLLPMVATPQPQQSQPLPQPRPPGTVTPVTEQRIVTGFAKNDPVPVPPVGPVAPLLATTPQGPPPLQPVEEVRTQSLSRSPPPPHRSETIGSENPRANPNSGITPTGGTAVGNGSVDRSDDRISNDRDRDRETKPHDRGSRVERERDRDDYDREGRNRYPDDDEDERFSTTYRERDRRYDNERDRERDHRDPRRYDDRDRAYNRQDYDDDRRSGYGPPDRDRARDARRRDTRRSDYYLTEAEMYERSGGRRSSLYEGENNDPAGDFNRSAYGFNTSRDGRRRDNDRSRIDDRYYQSSRDVSARAGAEVSERAHSERDYRHSVSSASAGRRRDPRDLYYPQDPRYYGYAARDAAYDPYRTGGYHHSAAAAAAAAAANNQQMMNYNQQINHALKYNYALFEELRLKNPAAYSEWYQRNYAQRYTPTVVTGGTGTALGSIAASEADRASVHSGRSSVNEDHPSMLANHSISQQLRGSTTGLDQSHAYDYSLYQDEDNLPLTTIRPTQDMTPHKFSCPHVIARFSPGGILLRVLPNSPKDGVAAHIELHDLNVLLGDLPTAQEMKFFPGPLVPGQTHKQQVAVFCQQKIRRATEDANQLVDRQSYILLWELLLLLLRQNGTIVGTDIAELLLKDHEILKEPIVQDVPESGTEVAMVAVDRTLVSRQTEASVTKKFRELLLFGNKKEALEWAMAQGLWGHALFLASKMDQRTYSSVMIRFANGLALTDPLQTLYQLMSGRQPTAVTSCGDDKWGDWRPHLAMILSNSSSKAGSCSDLDKKSIVTLGDTLSARGFLLAAHFCYLVAQVEFGSYSNKASKLVLLSSSSSLAFDAFATNEAIQCTEVYEYARQLAAPEFMIPSFQSYKFLYATRLAEHGRPAEALQYCEAVGNVLVKYASTYSPSLIDQVYQLGSMLKYSDPQFLTENDGTSLGDPSWLTALEAAAKTAQADYSPTVSGEKLTPEQQTTEPESSLPPSTDYSSYQQQPHGQQYGEQQQNTQQPQQQFYQPSNVQQPAYYEQQSGGQQQQQNYSEDGHQQQQQQANEQQSNSYPSMTGQDFNAYGSSQYNPSYSWQQPQQQQQQQQPWSYGETSTANGAPQTDYWNPSSNNLSATSADEDAGPSSFTDPSYFNPSTSSSVGPSADSKHTADDKQSGKQEGGNSNNSSKAAAAAARAQQAGSGGSWLGGFFSKFKPKTQMKLPDDKNPTIVWDPKKGQWVDTAKDSEDEAAALAPPPKDASFQSLPPMPLTPAFSSPAPASLTANNNNNEGNRFGLNKGRIGRAGRNAYVNPSNIKISSVNSPAPLLDPFPASTPSLSAAPQQFFVPSPAMIDPSSAPVDFVSSPAQPDGSTTATQGQADSGERFMYNPTQLAPPAAVASGRPGLASRGRYPR
ncbi:protein transport protein Sec16A-like isoform X3 [Daphnia carinata]|uniref:protein transport protein Sec16A-like isoform X3 n=1 Tax=Daphnia carinata TaxID=120202 RepID=UPI00286972F3|nr:protein transport protein Sec16A-like isoform X3 [Daphnia carinata]